MTKPQSRYTLDELLELAKGRERAKLELKSSAYVILDHPYQDPKVTDKSVLRQKCCEMLGKECGAFANSAGGTLVIGLNDSDGSLDPTPVPEFYEGSKTRIEEWIAALLKVSLEPIPDNIDCYTLTDPSDQSIRILVVEVPASDGAHQCSVDKRYYVRASKSSDPAGHWIIEAIRNRRVHPTITSRLLTEQCKIRKLDESQKLVDLELVFHIVNEGGIIAKEWAVRFDCPVAKKIEAVPVATYRPVSLPGTCGVSIMRQGPGPLYPCQEMELKAVVSVEITIEGNSEIKWLRWASLWNYPSSSWEEEEPDVSFYFDVELYADSAPPKKNRFKISSDDFSQKLRDYLATPH